MRYFVDKEGNKSLIPTWAGEVFAIDKNNRFSKKDLESILQEIGTGSAQSVSNLEEWVAQLSNPNILINSNFRDPVNQRGESIYICNGNTKYTIDRWNAWAGSSSNSMQITLVDKGLKIEKTSDTSTGCRLRQALEPKSIIPNSKVTVSIKVSDVTNEFRLGIFKGPSISNYSSGAFLGTKSFSEDGIYYLTVDIGEIDTELLIVDLSTTSPNASAIVEYIKLEYGDKATLFSPRPYTEEEILCKRYFNIIYNGMNEGEYNNAFLPQTYKSGALSVFEKFPVIMRTIPTITYDSIKVVVKSEIQEDGFTFSTEATNNSISIIATKANHGLTPGTCNITTSKLCLDSEIY